MKPFVRKVISLALAVLTLQLHVGCRSDTDNPLGELESADLALDVIDFSQTTTQAFRIMSMFFWEDSFVQFSDKTIQWLKGQKIGRAELLSKLIPNESIKHAFSRNATLGWNLTLMISGGLALSEALVLTLDSDPSRDANRTESIFKAAFKGLGMFAGGVLGMLFWAAQNPRDPVAVKIVLGLSKVSMRAVHSLLGYVEPTAIRGGDSTLTKLKGSLPKYFAAAPQKLYDSITAVKDMSAGVQKLTNAYNANGDLLLMTDELMMGITYFGSGTCRLRDAWLPGWKFNLPGAIFATAMFIRQQDGFANTALVSAIRAPLDREYDVEARRQNIRDTGDDVFHQWRNLWKKGERKIADENLRSKIRMGMKMAKQGDKTQPYAAIWSSLKPQVEGAFTTHDKNLAHLRDPVVSFRLGLLFMVFSAPIADLRAL